MAISAGATAFVHIIPAMFVPVRTTFLDDIAKDGNARPVELGLMKLRKRIPHTRASLNAPIAANAMTMGPAPAMNISKGTHANV